MTAGTEPEQVKELRRGGLLTSVTRPPRDDLWKFDGSIPLDDMHPHVLAQSRRQPHKFKAFRSELEVPNSWGIVDGVAEVWSTWEAFGQSKTARHNVWVFGGFRSMRWTRLSGAV